MKKLIKISIFIVILFTCSSYPSLAQKTEDYGNKLNIGLGLGYYNYLTNNVPVLNINYEYNIKPINNFTLAPSITIYNYTYKIFNYKYSETVLPIGCKAYYYFDELFLLSKKWDIYTAATLGFRLRFANDNYKNHSYNSNIFFDFHIGTQYQISDKAGIYLDLSNGISTLGLAFSLH